MCERGHGCMDPHIHTHTTHRHTHATQRHTHHTHRHTHTPHRHTHTQHTPILFLSLKVANPYSPSRPPVGSHPLGYGEPRAGQVDSVISSSQNGFLQPGAKHRHTVGAGVWSGGLQSATAPRIQCHLSDLGDCPSPAGPSSPTQGAEWLWHLRLGSRGPSTVTLMARW